MALSFRWCLQTHSANARLISSGTLFFHMWPIILMNLFPEVIIDVGLTSPLKIQKYHIYTHPDLNNTVILF